jgi:hypothetical protein
VRRIVEFCEDALCEWRPVAQNGATQQNTLGLIEINPAPEDFDQYT